MITLLGFVPSVPPEGTWDEVAQNFESLDDLRLLQEALEETFDTVAVVNSAEPDWRSQLDSSAVVFNYTYGFELMHRGIRPSYYLESAGFDYRGATPIGLMLSANKPHASALMESCGFRCPKSIVVPRTRALSDPDWLTPLAGCELVVIKPAYEEASVGLRLLPNEPGAVSRAIESLRPVIPGPFLVQEYIHGLDVTVPIIGEHEPYCLPAVGLQRVRIREEEPFVFDAVSKRSKEGLRYESLNDWPDATVAEIYSMARAAFILTEQRDYARLDCRLDSSGRAWFLEVTPNPEVRPGKASFAVAAALAGTTFSEVMAAIVDRRAPRAGVAQATG